MRAVSLASGFIGGLDGKGAGTAAGAAAEAGPVAAVPMGRGMGVLAGGGGGGGTAAGGGGGNVATGGLGNGPRDIGGRGIGTLPGFGTIGVDVGAGSDVGGPAGSLIRTVSSSCGATASP